MLFRIRRSGPRAGQRRGCQRRRRHRGVLQHRRTELEGHAGRRCRQVRHQRQEDSQERPRYDCQELRLCRPGRHGSFAGPVLLPKAANTAEIKIK